MENKKLMQWRRVENSDNASGLTLMMTIDGCNWYHYTNPLFSIYRKPELNFNGVPVKGASKGFTTAQYCLKLGFTYLPTEQDV